MKRCGGILKRGGHAAFSLKAVMWRPTVYFKSKLPVTWRQCQCDFTSGNLQSLKSLIARRGLVKGAVWKSSVRAGGDHS
jgi:hypothetical protein